MLPVIDRVRQNHAIEHATVAVLHTRRGRTVSTAGLSDPFGFNLAGDFEQGEVEAACQEAIARLRLGEHWLAVSPQCGTNLAVTGLFTSIAVLGTLGSGRRRDRFGDSVSAATLAALAAVPAGQWVQRRFTVEPEVGTLEMRSVRGRRFGRYAYWRVTIGDGTSGGA